jgi:hypothetical protein
MKLREKLMLTLGQWMDLLRKWNIGLLSWDCRMYRKDRSTRAQVVVLYKEHTDHLSEG